MNVIRSAAAWYGFFALVLVAFLFGGLPALIWVFDKIFRLMGGPGAAGL